MIANEIIVLGTCIVTLAILLTHTYTKLQTWRDRGIFTVVLIIATTSIYTGLLGIHLWGYFGEKIGSVEALSIIPTLIMFQILANGTFIVFLAEKDYAEEKLLKILRVEVLTTIATTVLFFSIVLMIYSSAGSATSNSFIVASIMGVSAGVPMGVISLMMGLIMDLE